MELQVNETMLTEKQSEKTYRAVLFILCFISSGLGGTVSTLMSVYLPVVLKDLQLGQNAQELSFIGGYINAIFILGWAFGGFSFGIISDRIGRKKAMLFSIAFYGLFTIATGLANSWEAVVICRFFSGFGVGGVLVTSFTLISEVWPNRTKAIYTGILSISFPVGIFSAGAINYAFSSWREGFFIGIVPVVIAVLGIWIVKESEKWLEHKNSQIKSQNTLKIMFSPNHRKEIIIGSLTFGSMLIGLWAIFSWLPTWVQSLIATDAQHERGLSMMCMGMGGLAGGFLSGWISNKLGVRRTLVLCFTVCSVMSFLLFKVNTVFTPIIYVEIIFLALFFGASQGILSVYIPQIFPTSIRSSATGFCFNVGRLFTATAVLLVSVLVTALGGFGNAIFIFSLVFLVGLLIVLFLKEKQQYN